MEQGFLAAIHDDPGDDLAWLVLGDWLEENDQPLRAELVRLQVRLRRDARIRGRSRNEARVQELLKQGTRPCVPSFTNSIGMPLALIPPGVFLMGSYRATGLNRDEMPRHEVEITRPYYLGLHHVTQGQYEQVMGSNPSWFQPRKGRRKILQQVDHRLLPVDTVSYEDLEVFCRRLSESPAEKKAGRVYRLPTEAEWEYACRAGILTTPYHCGKRLTKTDACYERHSERPMPVGSFPPNLFGLHDMHGNMWEWTEDWYEADYYRQSPRQDPAGPPTGARRVLRGGGWSTGEDICRSPLRGHNTVDARHNYNGVRVAITWSVDVAVRLKNNPGT